MLIESYMTIYCATLLLQESVANNLRLPLSVCLLDDELYLFLHLQCVLLRILCFLVFKVHIPCVDAICEKQWVDLIVVQRFIQR